MKCECVNIDNVGRAARQTDHAGVILDFVLLGRYQQNVHSRIVALRRPHNLVVHVDFREAKRDVLLGIELNGGIHFLLGSYGQHHPLHNDGMAGNSSSDPLRIELAHGQGAFDGVCDCRRIHDRSVDDGVRPQGFAGKARDLVALLGFCQFHGLD